MSPKASQVGKSSRQPQTQGANATEEGGPRASPGRENTEKRGVEVGEHEDANIEDSQDAEEALKTRGREEKSAGPDQPKGKKTGADRNVQKGDGVRQRKGD